MLKLCHTLLMTTCGMVGTAVLFLSAVLVYGVEPEEFLWQVGSAEAGVQGEAGSACVPIVLDQPQIAIKSIADFATEAVLTINSYDYLNWDQSIPEGLNTYFTPGAARAYFAQFSNSWLLYTVTSSYYTVSATTAKPAMVISSGVEGDVRNWQVQIPLTLRYQTGVTNAGGGTTVHEQTEVFTVTVLEQRPNAQNFRGVAINDITNQTVRAVDDLDRLQSGAMQ